MALREFKLPDPGEGLTEADLVTWHVAVGDTVKVNDIVVEVDAGRSHSFAIGGDGRLWAWGWNVNHQVSSSAAGEIYSPVEVPGLTDVVAAGGGQAYSVALTEPVDALLTDAAAMPSDAVTVTSEP